MIKTPQALFIKVDIVNILRQLLISQPLNIRKYFVNFIPGLYDTTPQLLNFVQMKQFLFLLWGKS